MNTESAWAWRLVCLGGAMPLTAGLVGLVMALVSASSGSGNPWLSLMGEHSFAARDLEAWNPGFYALWKLVNHIGNANLAASGVTIVWLGWNGLRAGHRWVRPILWFLFLWVGGNDVVALFRFRAESGQGVPVAVVPLILGVTGLLLSHRTR